MTRRTTLLLAGVLLVIGGRALARSEYPRVSRCMIWRPYEYDGHTTALYHLDAKAPADETVDVSLDSLEGDEPAESLMAGDSGTGGGGAKQADTSVARNAAPAGKDGQLHGNTAFVADGYFGGALRLDGQDGRLLITSVQGAHSRTVEFWIKVAAYPETEGVLIHHARPPMGAARRRGGGGWKPNLRSMALLLGADGSLILEMDDQRRPLGEARLPLDEWVHLSLSVTDKHVWPHGNKVHLFLNSKRRATCSPEWHTLFLLVNNSPAVCIGNDPVGECGVAALVDEVRVSRCFRDYYPWELNWPGETTAAEVQEGRPHFRDSKDLLFHLTFNKTLQPRRAAPETTWPDGAEVTEADEELSPAKVARMYPPGVEGTGYHLRDGNLWPVYKGAGNLHNESGTLAFWMQPHDWDNLTRDDRFDNTQPTVFSLFHLTGENVEGSRARTWGKRSWLLDFRIDLHLPEAIMDPVDLTPGQWYHVTFTWHHGTFLTYCNGRLIGEEIPPEMGVNPGQSGFTRAWNTVMSLARGGVDGGWYHEGNRDRRFWTEAKVDTIAFTRHKYWKKEIAHPSTVIDDFRVYGRALSPPEVTNLARLFDPRTEMEPLPPASLRICDANGVTGRVEVSVAALMEGYENAAATEVAVTKQGTAEAVGEKRVALPARKQTETTVETPPLAFATYQVEADVLDADGRSLGTAEASFTRKEPPWWNFKGGLSDKAMPGWDPVEVDGNRVRVSLREIELSAAGLPAKIVSRGKDVLAGAVSMVATAGGQPLALAAGDTLAWAEQTEGRAAWAGRLTGGGVNITTEGSIEFDGMMWFDITLAPQGESRTLDGLALTIPYADTSTRLLHWWSGNVGFRDFTEPRVVYIGKTPEGEGELFASNDRELINPAPHLRGSFMPYVMLTGMGRGMAWFAENDQGWTQSMETPAVSLVRQEHGVDLVLNVISEPVELTKPRTFSFGLHPTPVRALPKHWRNQPGGLSCAMADSFAGNNLKGPSGPCAFYVYPLDSDWEMVKRRINGEGLTEKAGTMKGSHRHWLAEFRKAHGRDPHPVEELVPGLYWDLQLLDGFPAHSREWVAVWQPKDDRFSNYTSTLNDFLAWCWHEWIVKTDKFVRGAYMDDCWGAPQHSALGACSYRLPDGHLQPGFQFRGYRERIKRMRQISLDLGLTPRLTSHTTNTYMIPYHSFFDIILDGEFRYSSPPNQSDFIDHYPLARMQYMNHANWGIKTNWLTWHANSLDTSDYPAWSYRQRRAYAANQGLHDIKWPFYGDVVRSFGIRKPDVAFVPYWDDQGLATHAHETVKVSAWTREGKCLVLVGNVGEERVEASIRLDPAVMGLGAAPAQIKIRHADPSLLRYFDYDVTTAADDAPETLENDPLAEPEAEGDGLLEGLEEKESDLPLEERRQNDPDGKFAWEDGVLSCPVRRHDYRLFLFERE